MILASAQIALDGINWTVQLTHPKGDPGTWIVRQWRRILWFRKVLSSHWFNDEQQARRFMQRLIEVLQR